MHHCWFPISPFVVCEDKMSKSNKCFMQVNRAHRSHITVGRFYSFKVVLHWSTCNANLQ